MDSGAATWDSLRIRRLKSFRLGCPRCPSKQSQKRPPRSMEPPFRCSRNALPLGKLPERVPRTPVTQKEVRSSQSVSPGFPHRPEGEASPEWDRAPPCGRAWERRSWNMATPQKGDVCAPACVCVSGGGGAGERAVGTPWWKPHQAAGEKGRRPLDRHFSSWKVLDRTGSPDSRHLEVHPSEGSCLVAQTPLLNPKVSLEGSHPKDTTLP